MGRDIYIIDENDYTSDEEDDDAMDVDEEGSKGKKRKRWRAARRADERWAKKKKLEAEKSDAMAIEAEDEFVDPKSLDSIEQCSHFR